MFVSGRKALTACDEIDFGVASMSLTGCRLHSYGTTLSSVRLSAILASPHAYFNWINIQPQLATSKEQKIKLNILFCNRAEDKQQPMPI